MTGANRYSTAVAWMKVALPLIALALLSTLFLFSRTPDPEAALPFADVDLEQLVLEQRLSRPRFAGTLSDGREVTLVADTATAVTEDPSTIALTALETRVTLAPGRDVTLSAETGNLDLAAQLVGMAGAVNAQTSDGYRLVTERMIVAMDDMQLSAPGPVVLTATGLTLEAGSMELSGAQDAIIVSFNDGVRLLYEPEITE